MSSISEIKKEYFSNPTKFNKPFQKKLGAKIVSVEFIEDTPDFTNLLGCLEDNNSMIFRNNPPFAIHTFVGRGSGYLLKVHNCLTFFFPEGSFVRISPIKNNKLEITRIETSKPGNGIGKLLMGYLLDYIYNCLGYVPPIQVDITGAVGFGETLRNTPIEIQKNFFEKFDFKVIKKNSNFVQLERGETKYISEPFLDLSIIQNKGGDEGTSDQLK